MIALDRRSAPAPLLAEVDPRLRVVAALTLVLAVATLQQTTTLAMALVVALGVAVAAGLGPSRLWQRLRHVEALLVMLVLLVPLSVPGTPVVSFLGVGPTAEGLSRALALVLKVNACVLVTLALVGTIEPVRLGRTLADLGAPPRLVHLYLFLVRYLDLARADVARLSEAMRARGFRLRVSVRAWRGFGQAAGAALVLALCRAERIEEAMRCRGFNGRLPRRAPLPLTAADRRAGAALLLLGLALVAWDRWP